MLVLTWMGTNMADGETTETSLIKFCYISANLSLKELINIKVILFLIHLKTVLINCKIPRNTCKSLFQLTYITAPSAIM